jgi:hypothetical protein
LTRLRYAAAAALAAAALGAAVLPPSATTLASDSAGGAADVASARKESPAALPFEPTEQLVYEGEFSKLLFRGIKIAEFRFTSSRPAASPTKAESSSSASAVATETAAQAPNAERSDARPRLQFVGDVKSSGWFHRLFNIDFHFRVESLVEREGFSVLSTKKLDEQGKRVRTSEAVFDRAGKKVSWTELDPNDPTREPRVVTNAFEGAAQDIVSAIYFLRTQQLTPGKTFELTISDSGQVYRVPATVMAEPKRMKTPLGKVAVVRVEVELFGEGRPVEGEGKMSLWITDDARRIPVRARMSSDIGMLDIKLKSVTTNPPADPQRK